VSSPQQKDDASLEYCDSMTVGLRTSLPARS
jgi:hypothetical protein